MKNLKIFVFILSGILLAAFSGYLVINSEYDYRRSLYTISKIEELGRLENELNKKIIECSFLLYYNYDNIINLLDKLNKSSAEIVNNTNKLEYKYKKISKELINRYLKILNEKNHDILLFMRLNSTTKNSLVYIPTLILKYVNALHNQNHDHIYTQNLTNIVSKLLLIRNNLDIKLVNELEENIRFLKTYKGKDKFDKKINQNIIKHLIVFKTNFSKYLTLLDRLNSGESLQVLKKLKNVYIRESSYLFNRLLALAIMFFTGILIAVSFVAYYILKLKKAAHTDYLTGLYNRNYLLQQIGETQDFILFIVNIDNFKDINNFYGVKVGDQLLKEFGILLKNLIKKMCKGKVIRLGSDDFGILIKKDTSIKSYQLANDLIDKIEHTEFKINNWNIIVSISIGIAEEPPLLEHADIALKKVKKNNRLKYLIYKKELEMEKDIENNMKILKTLKDALENDRIKPFFQPIINNKTDKIDKYECLVRIFDEKNNIISPGVFLEVAKKGKLYGEITKKVIQKSFEYFRNLPFDFAVNLSVEDITDIPTRNFIISYLEKYPDIVKRLTFEILESEGIEDFDIVSDFVSEVKKFGVKVAIDDFGSGYSNFSYLLKLNVDYIKIDGSLIRNIHNDTNSELIVKTIVNFTKNLHIKTVAEFVHNEEVFLKVKELNIDYSQGFHIGKPLEKIVDLNR